MVDWRASSAILHDCSRFVAQILAIGNCRFKIRLHHLKLELESVEGLAKQRLLRFCILGPLYRRRADSPLVEENRG